MAQIPVLFFDLAAQHLWRGQEISQVTQSHQDTNPNLNRESHLYVPHEYDWQSGEYPVA